MPDTGRKWRNVFAAMVTVGLSGAVLAADKTVAALDFCADQFVLAFADRKDIVAVSTDAVGPHSYFKARAKGLPAIRGNAEEILTRRPDLVIRSWRGSPAMDALFARVGVEAYQPPYAFDYEATLRNFEAAAEKIGATEKGKAYADNLRARRRALQDKEAIPLKAVYITPSGFTAGSGTSVESIIHLAGFETIAPDLGLNGWGALPLEKLVMTPPDVVIGSFFEEGVVHVSNWSGGRHGVFRGLIKDLPSIMLPSHLMSCGGAFTVEAAEYIRAEAERLGLAPTGPRDMKTARTGSVQ